MAGGVEENVQFATPVGLVFIFNLIIGTGSLAMPKAFQDAGYVLGVVTTAVLAFVSFLAFSFVVESMSIANAVIASKKAQKLKEMAFEAVLEPDAADVVGSADTENSSDRRSLTSFPVVVKPNYFEINQRVEIGAMAWMFLGRWGIYVFYGFLIVYLYGDLAIYSTVVPKSLMNVVCTYEPGMYANTSCISFNVTTDMPCWNRFGSKISRMAVYRTMVLLFNLIIGPFVFFNVSKTKYLQVVTTLSRWTAFLLMIGLASSRLANGQIEGHPPVADVTKFGNLFGISVYAFMCHHSLPSVVTPMKSKTAIYPLVSVVYVIILIFYVTLSMTGAFAYANLEDVYTLNFLRQCSVDVEEQTAILIVVRYFLALFPVLTLSTNFPIVGITLRNNIVSLVQNFVNPSKKSDEEGASKSLDTNTPPTATDEDFSVVPETVDVDVETPLLETKPEIGQKIESKKFRIFRRYLAPLVVLLPPLIVSLSTDNVEFLASVTGSYAGVGVQYVIPGLLAFGARRNMANIVECLPQTYASPFAHKSWIYLLFLWSALTVIVVTVNHILTGF